VGAFLLVLIVLFGVWYVYWPAESNQPTSVRVEPVIEAPVPAGRKTKRKHNLPPGSIDQKTLAFMVIGDGLKLTRVGPEVKVSVGYGVSIVMPKGMVLAGSKDGESVVAKVEQGAPYILLPVIGRLWPVGIIGMRLDGDLLTVELDGWADYQVKINGPL
jgi:hypothetical protein